MWICDRKTDRFMPAHSYTHNKAICHQSWLPALTWQKYLQGLQKTVKTSMWCPKQQWDKTMWIIIKPVLLLFGVLYHTVQGDETHRQSTAQPLSWGVVMWRPFFTTWLVDAFICDAKARNNLPLSFFCRIILRSVWKYSWQKKTMKKIIDVWINCTK